MYVNKVKNYEDMSTTVKIDNVYIIEIPHAIRQV